MSINIIWYVSKEKTKKTLILNDSKGNKMTTKKNGDQ